MAWETLSRRVSLVAATAGVPVRRGRITAALLLTAAALLGGCADSTPAPDDRSVYSEPPLPAKAIPIGTDTPVPARGGEQCGDPTASLRPSTSRGPTIDAIRARGRLIVGLDAGSNLFSFRDPLTGRIVGFDADIAR